MKLQNSFKLAVVLATSFAVVQASSVKRSLAQTPTDIDRLFDDEEDDLAPGQPNARNPVPPPAPPAPAQNFDNSNPNSNQGSNQGGAGFPSENLRGGGGGAPTFGSSSKTPTKANVKVPPVVKAGSKKPFKDAQIEDITNENYPDEIESFDYPNAEITDVIKAISDLTGKNFIIDSTVHGKISIVAPSKVTVAEAYKAFLAALAANGFTVVPYGKFLKIKNSKASRNDSIPTYSGSYFPNSDVYITKIIHLKHISADDVQKNLRQLSTRDGFVEPYPPTNSLIINDYGSNVEKITNIIDQLDKPGFDEQLAVIAIKYAKTKDLADLINAIINKDPTKGAQAGGFGVPRYRGGGVPGQQGGGSENLSLVTPDERTNALIVVGNKAGVEKVRTLVRKLDYKLDPSEGGVFVYFVRYGEAEKIAQTLSGVASVSPGSGGNSPAAPGGFGGFSPPSQQKPTGNSVFGGDVKIAPDKSNNSLIITASKQDYESIKRILAKVDVPRDQVFVEAIIMEMSSNRARSWDSNIVQFQSVKDPVSGQLTASPARSGFTGGNLASLIDPTKAGAILGFGSGETLNLTLGNQQFKIPSLLALVSFLATQTQGNILSTPQVLALDNEEALIEVGEKIPISQSISTTSNGQSTAAPVLEEVNISLKLTPHISPDSDQVRMKLLQEVKQPKDVQVKAAFVGNTTIIAKRKIDTNIVINSGDTAVLGGLIRDEDTMQEQKVPVLGDLPIIGWLFKSSVVTKDKVNLVVFITPKILRNSKDNHDLLNKKAQNRIEWIKKNFNGRDPYGKTIEELPRAEADEATERSKKND
jgi:general secretion pathway protein D